MEKTKYGKYFIEYDPTQFPKERRPVMVRMQESVMKGSHFYLIHWVMPGFALPSRLSATMPARPTGLNAWPSKSPPLPARRSDR